MPVLALADETGLWLIFALEINVIPWVAKACIMDKSLGVPLAKLPSLSSAYRTSIKISV